MNPGSYVYFDNYSPVADVMSLVLCILMLILISETFINRDKGFILFRETLVLVMASAMLNLMFHIGMHDFDPVFNPMLYILRALYHICLFTTLYLIVTYILVLLSLPKETALRFHIIAAGGLVVFALVDILGSFVGYGFILEGKEVVHTGFSIFAFAYVYYVTIIFYLMMWYRERVINQIFRGMIITFIICIVMQGVQGSFSQSSYTTAIFLFPIITLMYLLHSNPYDTETGAVNEAAFDRTIRESYHQRRQLMLLSLHLQEFDKSSGFSQELKFELFHFFAGRVKRGVVFHISGGRLVLVYRIDQNPNWEEVNQDLINGFQELYEKYKINFKIVITKSIPELSLNNDYPALIQFVEEKAPFNTYYTVTEDDILNFSRRQYIVNQLTDIAEKMDLDDPRVLVYCQPVYNVSTGAYDTAEALMRMELPETGFLFPDMFIPIAEATDLIHPLSLIILNKTCRLIRKMLDDGYHVHRISVNFSIQEVRDDSFSADVLRVIELNRIPYERVAIELTESRNTTDFEKVKEMINELKSKGIKFYLDDFGTGYSNFDRIMELPFDIIKFDRSLVIESGKDKTSEYMVHTFADMFHKLNYRVLYEGVEDSEDEQRCIRMFAQYLQGYKYSKPIPIEQLENFFSKVAM